MNRTFENLKGTYDYVSDKQILREWIKNQLQDVFKKYGFNPTETPILCKKDLLTSKYSEGADILKEMYTLSDQGKRELGLRYDLTITFAKLISSNAEILLPYKRYEIGKVFRNGPVKLGRNREFTQCDVDCVGVKSILSEAEYMAMTEESYSRLGLDIEILFNNRKIMTGIIECIFGKLDDEKMRSVIMLIDKFEKLSKQELLEEFNNMNISNEKVDKLYCLLDCDYDLLKNKLHEYPQNRLIEEGFAEVDELIQYLSESDAIRVMKFAPYLARGIDIYTGMVWEIVLKNRKIGNIDFPISIGGGGRYDKIITDFINNGSEYPAVGMSFGLDVIYEILNIKNNQKKHSCVDLFIIPIDTQKESFILANQLRKLGICVDMEKNHVRVKKSMNYANKENIPFTIVIGENEINSNKIFIHDMHLGENIEFSINDYTVIADYIIKKRKNIALQ